MFWEPIGAVVLSVFLTVFLFFLVYLAAYFIVDGGIKTGRKIKARWNDKKE